MQKETPGLLGNPLYRCFASGLHWGTTVPQIPSWPLFSFYLFWLSTPPLTTISLCNQPARSTQPCTLCGTVEWVSAFGLSNNNKWRWWRFWQPVQADSQPKPSGLVFGRRPLGAVLHSSDEPGELSQWLYHDSTINIVCLGYYYYYYYYGRIFRHFGDIQHQRMAWPWNLGLGTFKVIENGAVC